MLRLFCFVLMLSMVMVLPDLGTWVTGVPSPVNQAHAESKPSAKSPSKKKAAASKKSGAAKRVTVAARTKKARQISRPSSPPPPANYAELVVDGTTGTVLYEKNADQPRHPASLTKMMTLYLLFDALEKQEVAMSTLLPVSEKSATQPPTNIALDPGDQVPVRTAIEALVIRSANDVAMVVAEALGGSQEGFARKMNQKAKALGMTRTQFYNPSGLPDERQVTTATDMARLGMALKRDFPQYYHYFSQDEFSFNGRTYSTHNRLLGRYPGANGIKTGYIRASGYNLVTSVERGRTYLVGVVLGGRTGAARDQEMMEILDTTFLALANQPRTTQLAHASTAAPDYARLTPATGGEAGGNWGIQVGAYLDEAQAQDALDAAERLAKTPLTEASAEISSVDRAGQTYFRARLVNLTSAQAREACTVLTQQHRSCMMVRVDE